MHRLVFILLVGLSFSSKGSTTAGPQQAVAVCAEAKKLAASVCEVELKGLEDEYKVLQAKRDVNITTPDTNVQDTLRKTNWQWVKLKGKIVAKKLSCNLKVRACKSQCRNSASILATHADLALRSHSPDKVFSQHLTEGVAATEGEIAACEAFNEKSDEETKSILGGIASAVQSVIGAAATLGIEPCKITGGCDDGEVEDNPFATNETDPCSGLQGQLLLSCNGEGGSLEGTNFASVSAGLGRGQTTFGGGGSDFSAGASASDGLVSSFGDSSGVGTASSAASGTSRGGGSGGIGRGGFGGGGSASIASQDDFSAGGDADGLAAGGDKGFFGGGGGGSGGASAGGSSSFAGGGRGISAYRSKFLQENLAKAKTAKEKEALVKAFQAGKVIPKSLRGLASSSSGKAGPQQNNFSVIRNTYRKSKGSLYHK